MENELMKFDFEEPASNYYTELKKVSGYVKDLQTLINNMLNDYEISEKKKESDLAVQKAYEMFVKKEDEPVLDNSLDQECPVDEKVFDKDKNTDDFSILNLIPEQAKKWVGRLTIDEMIKAISTADKDGGYATEDEYIGELVDNLKDMAVAKYTNDILEGRIKDIEDEEIKSEVVDYMKRKDMDIPETLCPQKTNIERFIERLDKGCELELDEDTIDAIVEKLWNERNNVSIKIHNNKISLR